MANASYLASISGPGTSTARTAAPGEAMTDLGIGGARVTWQVTDSARRVIDPSVAIVIYDDNAGAPWGGTYTIDYLTSTVTLNAAAATTIKIQGNFLPTRQITNAYEMDISLARTLADTSLMGVEYTIKTGALCDITGSMSCYDDGNTVYTDVDLNQILLDGTSKVVKAVRADGTGQLLFFAMFESAEVSASIDGVQTLSASFSGNGQTALTTGQEVDFSWS